MPGGPGYPGSRAALADGGGRCCSASATAAARTCTPSPPTAAGPRAGHRRRRRRVVSVGASVAGGRAAAVVLATPTATARSCSSTSPAVSRDRTDRARRRPGRRSSCSCARSGSSPSPTARTVQGWLIRDRGARPWAAAARHPRRAAQRVERRRRPGAPVPPGTRRARLDGAAGQPARRATATARRSTPRRSAPGASRTPRTSSSRSTRSSRRDRRPGPARGHRILLRRLHDLLPDQQGRPVRGRRGRRRGQRPDQHGGHLGRRARAVASGSSAAQPWATGEPATDAMSPDGPGGPSVTTPTLLLHGDADIRCPVGQAEQWHVALRELGVRHASSATRARRTCSFSTAAVTSDRLQPAGGGLGGTVRKRRRHARPKIDAAHWQRRLAVLAERHKVPGASLGILRLGATARTTSSSRPPTAC